MQFRTTSRRRALLPWSPLFRSKMAAGEQRTHSPLTSPPPGPHSGPPSHYALIGGPEGTVVLLSAFTAGGAPCILAVAWSTIHCTMPSSSRGKGRGARRRWLASPGLCTLCIATAGYGFSWGAREAWAGRPAPRAPRAGAQSGLLSRPPGPPTYVFVELLRQLLDVTQDPLGVALIRPHACHLMGHQLWRGSVRPCPGAGGPPRWGSAHLIKQVRGAVGHPTLRHEAGKGHALQHLHQKVVLHQPTLAQEGCLGGTRRSAHGHGLPPAPVPARCPPCGSG